MMDIGVDQCFINVPQCIEAAHDWVMRANVSIHWEDRYARGVTTYTWAIQCTHCGLTAHL